MIKLIKNDEKEDVSLEEVGLEMAELIGLSFFDDILFSRKVFQKSIKAAFEQEQLLINKFIMFTKSKPESKEYKKNLFTITANGIYKIKEEKNSVQYKFMPFEKTRMVLIENPNKENGATFPFGFHFFRTQKTYKMCTEDQALFEAIKNIIIYKTIQHTFHEEFDVQKLIGKGSFAKVYYAVKRDTQVAYAIKAFSKEGLSSQQNGREGLLNEINIMRCLNHKNILKLYEVFETEHSIYLVVDLLNGGELVSRIQSTKKPPTYLDIVYLAKNLLEAIEHMHKEGIMHRDIKPENLLLRDESEIYDIVLADFGLATKIKQPMEEILFKRCGTPGFVAPEILGYKEGKSEFYNEKCDIFSVGCLLYLLLTGKKLFKGENCVEVLKDNKECCIDLEGKEVEGVPDIAIDLLMKLLAVLPEVRFTASKALQHKFFENMNMSKIQIDLKIKHESHLSDYKQLSPMSPHKQGNSPIIMKRTLLNGKVEPIDIGDNVSPKKGNKHLLGKMNFAAGFSDFTEDTNKTGTPNNQKVKKSPENNEKKNPSILKKVSKK